MYRTRIHQWGLNKKLKEHEARAIIQMHVRRGDKATRMRLRDLPVDIKKAYSHFKRKGITIDDVLDSEAALLPDLICETPAASPEPMSQDLIPIVLAADIIPELQNRMMIAGPQGLGTPAAFRMAEMLFVDTREYLIGSIHLENGHDSFTLDPLGHGGQIAILLSVVDLYGQHRAINRGITKDHSKSLEIILRHESCEAVLLIIRWMAMLLGRQQQEQKSTALVLCKQLYSAAIYFISNRDPIISALGRLLSKMCLLIHHDDAPHYLLAMTHVILDSLKTLLAPPHRLTVIAAVTLSRMMCSLYGPEGLLSSLETLWSSLEKQDGWGMEQLFLIMIEMINIRCGQNLTPRLLLKWFDRASSEKTYANIWSATLSSKFEESSVQVSLREMAFCFKYERRWDGIRK